MYANNDHLLKCRVAAIAMYVLQIAHCCRKFFSQIIKNKVLIPIINSQWTRLEVDGEFFFYRVQTRVKEWDPLGPSLRAHLTQKISSVSNEPLFFNPLSSVVKIPVTKSLLVGENEVECREKYWNRYWKNQCFDKSGI